LEITDFELHRRYNYNESGFIYVLGDKCLDSTSSPTACPVGEYQDGYGQENCKSVSMTWYMFKYRLNSYEVSQPNTSTLIAD